MKGLYRSAASAAIAWGVVVAFGTLIVCGGDARAMPSPILHWKLDETAGAQAADSSGNGNIGAVNGATWTAMGQIGGALQFDGFDDYVEDDDGESYINGLDAITVTMWIKSDSIGVDNGFLTCDFLLSQQDRFLSCRYDNSGGSGGGDDVIKIGVDSTGGAQQYESASNVQTTEWQHIAFTWAGGQQIQLYIGGALDTPTYNSPATSGTISGPTTLILGGGPKFHWAGLIDDFRIYDVVLTEVEIGQTMLGADVTIKATDPDATEGDPATDTGVFTVTRSEVSSAELLVNFTFTGDANRYGADKDYDLSGVSDDTVTIPANQASATIVVEPFDDDVPEPDEDVIITIVDGTGYAVGLEKQDFVTITDDDVPEAFDPVSPPSPADGQKQVDETVDITLEWSPAAVPLADTYTIYLDEDENVLDGPLVESAPQGGFTYVVSADTFTVDMHIYWTVVASNIAGTREISGAPLEFYTMDTIPPWATRSDPKDLEGDVDTSSEIRVYFNERMADAATTGAAEIRGPDGQIVPGAWSLGPSGTVLVFKAGDRLEEETTYTVTVAPTATDYVGNPLNCNGTLPGGQADDGYAFSFTTWDTLTGLVGGDGCVPASPAEGGVAWLVTAIAAVVAGRVNLGRRLSRRTGRRP